MFDDEQEDTTVAFCAGCSSTIPDRLAEKDIFLQQGMNGVCPFCGGPAIITDASEVERLKEHRKQGRII